MAFVETPDIQTANEPLEYLDPRFYTKLTKPNQRFIDLRIFAKPISAYHYFLFQTRRALQQIVPRAERRILTLQVWNDLTPAQKQPYEDLAEEDRLRYIFALEYFGQCESVVGDLEDD